MKIKFAIITATTCLVALPFTASAERCNPCELHELPESAYGLGSFQPKQEDLESENHVFTNIETEQESAARGPNKAAPLTLLVIKE